MSADVLHLHAWPVDMFHRFEPRSSFCPKPPAIMGVKVIKPNKKVQKPKRMRVPKEWAGNARTFRSGHLPVHPLVASTPLG